MHAESGSTRREDESDPIQAYIGAIRQNLLLLKRSIGDDSARSREVILELHSILMDTLWQPGENIECQEIRSVIMNTRGKFWDAILGAPNPRRAFIRWLKHLDDVTTGRVHCRRFTRIRKSE